MLILLLALQQLPEQNFPPIDRPGVVPDLPAAIAAACGTPVDSSRTQLLQREDRIAMQAHGASTADTWLQLGCVRAQLDANGALSRPGLLMVPGNSWAQGAERAMLEALKTRPADERASAVLSLLALDDQEPDNQRAALAAVVAAVDRGSAVPAALRACDELALRANQDSVARHCANLALMRGVDSTWHLLRLARLSFRAADTASGMQQFALAAASAHDSAARLEVNWHLQWFLSPAEERQWATLPDSAYGAWVRDRLLSRDVRDGQPFGARLATHFSRLEYALTNFPLHLPEVAQHGRGLVGVTPPNGLADTLVRSFCEPGLVPARPLRDYRRWQRDIDDRGVIWLRFGKPDQRIVASPTCSDTIIGDPIGATHADGLGDTVQPTAGIATNAREVWIYKIDGQLLLLNFESENFAGSVAPTRLVSGVLGSYFCNVDVYRCRLSSLSQADFFARTAKHGTPSTTPQVPPEDIEHVRQDDDQFISEATTKDDNSVRGDRNIQVTAQWHRLWDPLSGDPLALVTWAVPVRDLSIQAHDSARTAVLDVAMRQWDPIADWTMDTTVTRRYTLPDTSVKHPALNGFVVLPSSSGMSAWSVVVSQVDNRRGRAYDVDTPGLGNRAMVLSDLVLGVPDQGLVWELHNVAIPLAPTALMSRTTPVSLYYQVRCSAAVPSVQTTVALYRAPSGLADSPEVPAFQVTYPQALHAGINEIAPTLDLSRLDPGAYRLEVRLSDADGHVVARRDARMVLQ